MSRGRLALGLAVGSHMDLGASWPGSGLQLELGGAAGATAIEQELGHAPQPVAAHARFRAVGVVHDHAPREPFLVGLGHQDQAVGTDGEMAVRDVDGQLDRIGNGLRPHVHVDVVVAGAVHLHEFDRHFLTPGADWITSR